MNKASDLLGGLTNQLSKLVEAAKPWRASLQRSYEAWTWLQAMKSLWWT
jgi:hypothetical protein